MPHRQLLHKLVAHEIIGKVNKWIENWLSDRLQRVVLIGAPSFFVDILSGVPQGSVLGHCYLLFILMKSMKD